MKKDIDKIADYLLLRSADMQDVGFFHGKTGVVAALYLYADAGGDDVLRDFAWELFQQVYDGVHTEMPLGLERGLAGIGYATAWLCRRGLLEGSLNDTLADIDAKIMEHDPRRLTDMSVRTGVGGLLLYLRLRQSVEPVATFDASYLSELQAVATARGVSCAGPDLLPLLSAPSFDAAEYVGRPLGIDGGSSYYLLKFAGI